MKIIGVKTVRREENGPHGYNFLPRAQTGDNGSSRVLTSLPFPFNFIISGEMSNVNITFNVNFASHCFKVANGMS